MRPVLEFEVETVDVDQCACDQFVTVVCQCLDQTPGASMEVMSVAMTTDCHGL